MGLIKAPVTALATWENYLLTGIGSFLKVYDVWNKRICGIKKIFEASVIHGIKILPQECCCFIIMFGDRDLQMCRLTDHQGLHNESFKTILKWRAKDWIWDITFVYSSDQSTDTDLIAAALGHNSILLLDQKTGTELKEIHCEEKCILYSAHFIETSRPTWETLTLCSGTVFNQVVIWKPSFVEGTKAKVLKRIHAHDGVIFNMCLNLHCGLLVTASDDRSIRVWDCMKMNYPRESCTVLDSNLQIPLLCKLYGHESRVWKAQCFRKDDKMYLVSVGEDGYCIIWMLNESDHSLNNRSNLEGIILKKMKCHKGKNIWSMVIDERLGILSTGGGDGGLRLWRISDLISDRMTVTKYPFPDLLNDKGVLKSIHACTDDIILGHTDSGVLLKFEIKSSLWSELHTDDNFKSYAIMRVCDEAFTVAIGNTKGDVKVLYFDPFWNELRSANSFRTSSAIGKIHNLSWEWRDDSARIYISDAEGCLSLYNIDISNFLIEKYQTWNLPLAKHRWHMGAISLMHESSIYVVCGDRRGSLHLYKQGVINPLQTIHGVHGKNGVTSVKHVGSSIISTGRDGLWRVLHVDFCEEKLKINRQNKAAQGMDWLESAICMNTDLHEVGILGFHGRNFIAWSSDTGDILLSIECGGGHRNWSFKTENGKKSLLAFIKQSTLHVGKLCYDVTLENSVLESHFHGAHITCMKHVLSWFHKVSSSTMSILVTGGEDTKVIVSLHTKKEGCVDKLRKLCVIDDHVSSVRSLAYLIIENTEKWFKVLLSTGGGRAKLNCYLITIDKESPNVGKNCNFENIASHSWNSEANNCKTKSIDRDPELRYMDLSAWNEDGKSLVAAACSDAVIRLFQIDMGQKKIVVTAQSASMHHCFLTIRSFTVSERQWILSGATDGHIQIWELCKTPIETAKVSECFRLKSHMSGINAIDMMNLPSLFETMLGKHVFLLASGGDDNAIQLNVLTYKNYQFQVIYAHTMDKPHSAQVTGLKLCFLEITGSFELMSSSIDQRVVRWEIFLDQNRMVVKFKNSSQITIADVSALEVWRCRNEVFYSVCGQGLQMADDFS